MHQTQSLLTSIMMSPFMKAIFSTIYLKLTASIAFYQRTARLFSFSFFPESELAIVEDPPLFATALHPPYPTEPPCTTILFFISDPNTAFNPFYPPPPFPPHPPPAFTPFYAPPPFNSLAPISLVEKKLSYLLSISLCRPPHSDIVHFLLLLRPSFDIT